MNVKAEYLKSEESEAFYGYSIYKTRWSDKVKIIGLGSLVPGALQRHVNMEMVNKWYGIARDSAMIV